MDLEQHVLYMRNESNAIPSPHVDCTDSPRRYTPGQAGDHNRNSRGPKTIKCVLTGCGNSDVLYNVIGHNYHISTPHVKLSCPVLDCGILIHPRTDLRFRLFTPHRVKSTMDNVEAVASSLVNADYHGHSTTKIRESQENDAITWNERQVERFVQDEVDISEINLAGTAYGQDEAALERKRTILN